jgi:alkylhydroperoxidase family enzyme
MSGDVDDPRFTPRERAAVAYADQFWHDHNGFSDELWAEITTQFPPEELVELAMSVAQNMAMGKIIAMMGIPNPLFRNHDDHDHDEHEHDG